MPYMHRMEQLDMPDLAVGKAVCVGRNYAAHAHELNNPVPDEPLLFIKPNTAFCDLGQPLQLPAGECHFETELTVLIGERISKVDAAQAKAAIVGVGLGLDLTLRQLQSELKAKQHPWEIAKAFDNSCPLSAFIPAEQIADLSNTEYQLWLNGKLQQYGLTRQMLMPVYDLVAFCSQHFTLLPGDVVLTGTPAGVGVLQPGDQLKFDLAGLLQLETTVS